MHARIRQSRRQLSSVAASVALLGALTLAFGPAAFGDESETGLEPIGTLAPDDSLDPRILLLDFDSGSYRAAVESLERGLFARESVRRELRRERDAGRVLRSRVDELRTDVETINAALEAATVELDVIEAEIATRAVERFVRHGTEIDAQLDPVASIEAGRGARLSAEVDVAQLERRAGLRESVVAGKATLTDLRTELIFTDISLAMSRERTGQLLTEVDRLDDEITTAIDRVATSRRSARVAGTGMSAVALDAYLRAETNLAETDPGCGLRWWMVAGVARVESRHGELGGRRLRADGRVDDPIIGIALDGGPSVQLVLDTDGGRLDDDPEFDRAVGPLQFIPETWDRLGRDGNDDGIEDPQNIYDSSLAAAVYLCRLGSDLTVASELRGAFHGYNSSWEYVDAVHGHAVRYSELGLPDLEPASSPVG